MSLQLSLCKELFLAVMALEDLLHVHEHVLLQRLPVYEHLTAVITEHAGVQQVIVLHLQMLFDFSQLLEVLTAAVTTEGSHLGTGVGRPVAADV